MMAEDLHLLHAPRNEALTAWIGAALGSQVQIAEVALLSGATSSTLYRIRVREEEHAHRLILRLFTNQEWLRAEPDLVRHEAASLDMASRVAIAPPRLVAVDEHGAFCGAPAVLMSEVPGQVVLQPLHRADWLGQLADALAQLHRVEAPTFPWSYSAYNDLTALQPPTWSSLQGPWRRAIRYAQGRPPESRRCFIHRDYHPCNVLWVADQLSGIVDWVNACHGPAGIDVGHCRLNLALLMGLEAADAFLDRYRSAAGEAFAYHPYWDVVSLLEFLPGPPEVYQGWIDFGVTDLTPKLMAERLDAYMLSLLERL